MTDRNAASDPRFTAALTLLGRTGVQQVQVRYSDDEQPVVWMVAASWRQRRGDQDGTYWEAAGGMDPLRAALRLLDVVIDGGTCTHCRRQTFVSDDWTRAMPLNDLFCWYVFDPERKTFRRSCEGDADKVGRNDPCPCGSGRKYKRCHGGAAGGTNAGPGPAEQEVDDADEATDDEHGGDPGRS